MVLIKACENSPPITCVGEHHCSLRSQQGAIYQFVQIEWCVWQIGYRTVHYVYYGHGDQKWFRYA